MQHDMQISERELTALTNDLDEAHRAAMPKMRAAIGELVACNRRTFLIGGGTLAGAGLLAACSSSSKSSSSSSAAASSGGTQHLTGDLAVAALAASLENLAVQTYQAGLDAANAGKLGAVPQAVATFAQTAQSQHKDHAAAWNSILQQAGKTAVTGVDTTVNNGVVQPAFAQVTDVVGLAKLALELESVAAATYLNGIQNALTSNGAIKIAATIQPVEMQHVAILNFVLGTYPIPDSFAQTTGARGPSDAIG